MILVEHATVITVDAERRVFADGSVLVDGARILQVGPSREVHPPREPDRVIDGSRLVVTPGFVDTHAALLAGIEMIRTGTTTFCEAGTLFDTGAVADAVERLGMRAILGRWTWDLESGPDRMRQTTAEALAATDHHRGRAGRLRSGGGASPRPGASRRAHDREPVAPPALTGPR